MNAKKLTIGAGLAGAGVLAARSLGPKLHEHCRRACAGGKCGGAQESDEPRGAVERKCGPQPAPEMAA